MTIFLQILISVIENITFLGNMFFLTDASLKKVLGSVHNIILILCSTIFMYFVQATNNSPYILVLFLQFHNTSLLLK